MLVVCFRSYIDGVSGAQISIDSAYDTYMMAKEYCAEVGTTERIVREEAIAILEPGYSQTIVYLVCTPNRGVIRDMPILVGENEVYSVTDFDE